MEKITNLLPSWTLILSQIETFVAKSKEYDTIRKKNGLVLTAASALIIYLGAVRYLRYKNLAYIRRKYPNPQDVLDNIEIAREINAITMKKDFPFLSYEGTEFALFKTYSIPSISKLLVATGEFAKECPRRVEDTALILSEIVDTYARIEKHLQSNPNTPQEDVDKQWERPKLALNRLNEIHGKYVISNADFLYTLSLFIFEPVAWINKYGWRQLDEREINALFCVWYHVGVAMNLKDIPDTPVKMFEFKNKYANENVKYSPTNWKCSAPTLRHILSNMPSFLREPLFKCMLRILPSLLDPQDAEAFHLPHKESKMITNVVNTVFFVSALVTRHCMLPRSVFVNRTPFYSNKEGKFVPEFFDYKPPVYKDGYAIGELGPEKFKPLQNIDVLQKKTGNMCPMMHDL